MKKTIKVFLAISVIAILTACASGSVIVTGNPRTPIEPDQVKLYLEAPTDFEVIGIVTASSDAGWNEQGSMDYAVQELKNQAAKLGANGVLIGNTGKHTSGHIGHVNDYGFMYSVPVTASSVTGKAIFVNN